MSQPLNASAPGSPGRGRVEIRVQGRLDTRWRGWFGSLEVADQHNGTTLLHGVVVDQSALFGVLQTLRDLALPVVSVVYVDSADSVDSVDSADSVDSHRSPGPPPTPDLSTPSTDRRSQP